MNALVIFQGGIAAINIYQFAQTGSLVSLFFAVFCAYFAYRSWNRAYY